jgi:hypothetical protein
VTVSSSSPTPLLPPPPLVCIPSFTHTTTRVHLPGYCIFPLNIAAGLCLVWPNAIWRALVISGGCAWSSRASVVFMAQLVPEPRRALAVFPVFLFYILLSWVILVGTYSH